MNKLRSVNTHFWDDSYVVNLDPIEKLLFLYFVTNPLCNLLGIYEISLRRIAFDTGIDKDMVLKILSRFEKDGKATYRNGYIVLANYTKNQKYNSNMLKNLQTTYNDLPESVQSFVFNENSSIPKKIRANLDGLGKPFESLSKPFEPFESLRKDEVEVEVESEVEKEVEKTGEVQTVGERSVAVKDYFLDYLPIDSSEDFIKAWVEWVDYRKEIRKKLTKTSVTKQLKFLAEQPDAVACINQSIQNQWQGLFEHGTSRQSSKQGYEFDPVKYEMRKKELEQLFGED